jgi:hypothetical protein
MKKPLPIKIKKKMFIKILHYKKMINQDFNNKKNIKEDWWVKKGGDEERTATSSSLFPLSSFLFGRDFFISFWFCRIC